MKIFLISYLFEEKETILEMMAKDQVEAQARLDALKITGKFEGELVAQRPVISNNDQRSRRAPGLH
jgi:cytoskeletal protein CcmA (bactofilin family)